MSEWWLVGLLVLCAVLASILMVYPLRKSVAFSVVLIPVICILTGIGYYSWGGFALWQDYIHQENSRVLAEKMMKSIKKPQDLIDKLRSKLDDSPKSAKGWYLLGRLYSSQNDTTKAVSAFAKAYQLQPDEEQFAVNYAHGLWELNQQQFTPEITRIFSKILAKNPNQPDALAMLAMDAYLSHAYEDAIRFWERLLQLAPKDSEEASEIRKAIAKAEQHSR